MAVPINKINNKGVDFTHSGDIPSYCIRCGKPPEHFMAKRVLNTGLIFVEFFCHEDFNKEMDDMMTKNSGFKPGLNRRNTYEKNKNDR